MHIAALILAAGPSKRLGEPKQLLDWGGPTLLGHVVLFAESLPVDETWVVLGSVIETILKRVDFGQAGIIQNLEWEEGMASSLRVGLDAITRSGKADAVLILLGDQPEIDGEVVHQLIDRYKETKAGAVIPKYRYQRGNPVLVDRSLWSQLMSLEGDQGARNLLQAHPEWVEEVWFPFSAPRDVDTVEDVADLHPDRHK